MKSDGMAYIAKLPCGCICGAIADKPDDPAWRRTIAKETGAWIKDGLTVERVPDQTVRDSAWSCVVCKPELHGQLRLL